MFVNPSSLNGRYSKAVAMERPEKLNRCQNPVGPSTFPKTDETIHRSLFGSDAKAILHLILLHNHAECVGGSQTQVHSGRQQAHQPRRVHGESPEHVQPEGTSSQRGPGQAWSIPGSAGSRRHPEGDDIFRNFCIC